VVAQSGVHGIVLKRTEQSSELVVNSNVMQRRVGHHQHTTAKSGAIKPTCLMDLTTTQSQFMSQ